MRKNEVSGQINWFPLFEPEQKFDFLTIEPKQNYLERMAEGNSMYEAWFMFDEK